MYQALIKQATSLAPVFIFNTEKSSKWTVYSCEWPENIFKVGKTPMDSWCFGKQICSVLTKAISKHRLECQQTMTVLISFLCCDKTPCPKSNMGKKGRISFMLPYHGPSSKELKAGTRRQGGKGNGGRNPRQKPRHRI